MDKQKVVIIGSSYASAAAYHYLEKSLSRARDVTELLWIADKNHYFINGLLTQVLCDTATIDDVVCGLRSVGIIKPGVSYLHSDVRGIDFTNKIIKTNNGTFDYSYLILSPDNDLMSENVEDSYKDLLSLNSPLDAIKIRNHVQKMLDKATLETDPNKKSSLLTFCVIGASMKGIEIACALSDYINYLLKHFYPELYKSQVKIYLIEEEPNLFAEKDPFFKTHIFYNLNKKRIQLLLDSRVTIKSERKILINQEKEIESDTLLFSFTNKHSSLIRSLDVKKDDDGKAFVNIYLLADGFDDVFVIGNCSKCMDLNEENLPELIVSHTQAELCASNILSKINNNPLNPIKPSVQFDFMFLGANNSIMDIKGFYVTGFLGWLIHRFIYVLSSCGAVKKMRSFVSYLVNVCSMREKSYFDFFEKQKEKQIVKK